MGQCQCLDRDRGLEVSTINRRGAVDILAFVGSTDDKADGGQICMEPIETEAASLDRDPAAVFEDLRVQKVSSGARQKDGKLANGFALTSNQSPIRVARSKVSQRGVLIKCRSLGLRFKKLSSSFRLTL